MIRVCFLINSLGGGGAEKVLVNLVNNMDYTKYKITIITMYGLGVNAADINKEVTIINRNKYNIRGLSKLIKYIPPLMLYRYYIREEYDIEIAFLHGAATKVLSSSKKKKIAWLHADMHYCKFETSFTSEKKAELAFSSYNRIIGVSKYVSDSFRNRFGENMQVETIYNTIDREMIEKLSYEEVDCKIDESKLSLIALGRLSEEKGFERLVEIAKEISTTISNFHIHIIGDGPLRFILQNKINEMEVNEYITLEGYQTNPYSWLRKADVLVASSYTEGLSTVVCEAIVLGVPVVSTQVSGIKEALGENGEYGMIVENDTSKLCEALYEILKDSNKLQHYARVSKLRSSFFNVERSVGEVQDLLANVIEH